MRKVVFGVLLIVPVTDALPPELDTEVNTGKFCRLFGPVCGPHGLLRVTPSPPRSIPRAEFEKMEFDRIALPLPVAMRTPAAPPL